ncbi:hypothetical protein SEVIR_2G252100v4 [Setaria viridis]|uniref:Uncharacterized protein n=1 Tax=Setaria viridis TaxID=4556 RepID=A0A4U6W7V0_SETVI|nr:uncharacterized protein LOC117845740 [Setaria viridis]TKW33637.1 hypothetical protein SEVIR_2G252100v2 [Setaria viridis]
MRCAAVLLALLLSLSALSASTAEAHEERLDDDAVLLSGRRWLRGRRIIAATGHGDAGKKDEVVEGKGAKSTGADQEADAPAEAVHDSGKRSKGSATHAMFQAPRQGDTAAVIPEVLGMDYNYKLDARHHRPINNDAPLEDIAKKP